MVPHLVKTRRHLYARLCPQTRTSHLQALASRSISGEPSISACSDHHGSMIYLLSGRQLGCCLRGKLQPKRFVPVWRSEIISIRRFIRCNSKCVLFARKAANRKLLKIAQNGQKRELVSENICVC